MTDFIEDRFVLKTLDSVNITAQDIQKWRDYSSLKKRIQVDCVRLVDKVDTPVFIEWRIRQPEQGEYELWGLDSIKYIRAWRKPTHLECLEKYDIYVKYVRTTSEAGYSQQICRAYLEYNGQSVYKQYDETYNTFLDPIGIELNNKKKQEQKAKELREEALQKANEPVCNYLLLTMAAILILTIGGLFTEHKVKSLVGGVGALVGSLYIANNFLIKVEKEFNLNYKP